MKKKKKLLVIALLIVLISVFNSNELLAQAGNIAEDTFDKFQKLSDAWGSTLENAAKNLFMLTLTIEIVLFGIRVALNRSQPQEIFAEFISVLLFAGFIAAVILNYKEWSETIVYGLQKFSGQLGYGQIDVANPFTTGFRMIKVILIKIEVLGFGLDTIGQVLFLMFIAVIIAVVFLLISAVAIIVKCEFIIVANIGLLIVGLGGSKIFKEYALNVMRYVFSVGLKLLTLQIIVGIGMDIIDDLRLGSAISGEAEADLIIGVCAALLLLVLAIVLPNTIAGIINGSHISGANPIASAGSRMATSGMNFASNTARSALSTAGNVRTANQIASAQGVSGVGNRFKSIRSNMKEANLANSSGSIQSQLQSKLNQVKSK